MKELRNNTDYETTFTDLQEAKEYYMPKEKTPGTIEDFLGDDWQGYCNQWQEYKNDIVNADSLEELAQVLNKYTDIFSDGREHIVKEF